MECRLWVGAERRGKLQRWGELRKTFQHGRGAQQGQGLLREGRGFRILQLEGYWHFDYKLGWFQERPDHLRLRRSMENSCPGFGVSQGKGDYCELRSKSEAVFKVEALKKI